jgi:hypothetical protein
MKLGMKAAVVAFFVGLAPAASDAGVILAPFAGKTFGGGRDAAGDDSHFVYGATLTLLGDGLIGFEVDGQYAPNYFGDFGDSNVASLMGSLTLGGGGGGTGVRFYANAGAGLLRTHVADRQGFFDTDRNSFGITAGGSVILPLGSTFGLKGDVRYFRGLVDSDSGSSVDLDLTGFHFWRASAGLALRF